MSTYKPIDIENKIKENLKHIEFIVCIKYLGSYSTIVPLISIVFLEVIDESDGCGGKFACTIVSNDFQGKALLARHRLVNTILAEELKTIHAFSQKTLTPEQYSK